MQKLFGLFLAIGVVSAITCMAIWGVQGGVYSDTPKNNEYLMKLLHRGKWSVRIFYTGMKTPYIGCSNTILSKYYIESGGVIWRWSDMSDSIDKYIDLSKEKQRQELLNQP